MEKEIWKEIKGYEGIYEISTLGRVKRLSHVRTDSLGRTTFVREKILKGYLSKSTGYPCINLSKDNKTYTYNIHRLIAEAFIPNTYNLPCINHIDENRRNSVLSNLEWCDYSYNNYYGSARKKRKETLRANLEGKHKLIYQYDLNGILIDIHYCGIQQLEEKLGYHIGDCLLGKSKSANGFYFSYDIKFKYTENLPKRHQKYVIKIDENNKEIERYKSVSHAAKENGFDRHYLSRNKKSGIVEVNEMRFIVEQKENEYIPKGHKGSRPDLKGKGVKAVSQYTKDGEFIQSFNSTKEAAESIGKITCSSDITNCCKGKLKSAYGYIWTYKDAPKPKPFIGGTTRKIEQYTINGEYVATFNSIKEAAISVGNGKAGSIFNNLRGISHSAFGFIWRYANTE